MKFVGESSILPVVIHGREVHFEGNATGLDPQGVADGTTVLFARPFDITLTPASDDQPLRGVIRRIHGLGRARRVEIVLGRDGADTVVEIDALRASQWRVGQMVALQPQQYRLFRRGENG